MRNSSNRLDCACCGLDFLLKSRRSQRSHTTTHAVTPFTSTHAVTPFSSHKLSCSSYVLHPACSVSVNLERGMIPICSSSFCQLHGELQQPVSLLDPTFKHLFFVTTWTYPFKTFWIQTDKRMLLKTRHEDRKTKQEDLTAGLEVSGFRSDVDFRMMTTRGENKSTESRGLPS